MGCETLNVVQNKPHTESINAPTKPVNAHLQHSKLGGMCLAYVFNYLI